MSIQYTYKILEVLPNADTMYVVYSSAGREDITIGIRLPIPKEDLEKVLHRFSPISGWESPQIPQLIPVTTI